MMPLQAIALPRPIAQLGLFGGEDILEWPAAEPEVEWSGEEERELFALRAIGALLEDSLERLPEMDEEERAETLAWIFLLGERAVVPFDFACRLYGFDPERIRGEVMERYGSEVGRLRAVELETCSSS